jgi:hypothetical protein
MGGKPSFLRVSSYVRYSFVEADSRVAGGVGGSGLVLKMDSKR